MKISSLFFLLAVFYDCYVMSMEAPSQGSWYKCPDPIIMSIVALLRPRDKQSFCLVNKKFYSLAGKKNIENLLHYPCRLTKNQHVDFMVQCAKNNYEYKMILAIKNAPLCKRKNAVSIISYFIDDDSSINHLLSLYKKNPCDDNLQALWPIIKFVYSSGQAYTRYKDKYLLKNLREKFSPLQAAVYCDDVSIARLFLSQEKHGILNLTIAHGMVRHSPLHLAVGKCHVAMVKLLCSNNYIDINVQSFSGKTPLHIAVTLSNMRNPNDKFKIIKMLLQAGANPNIQTIISQSTVLISAVSVLSKKDVIEYLLNYGALIDMQNKSGDTAAMIAVNNDDYDVLQLLLQRNANVNIQNNNKQSLLHRAVEKGNKKILHLLYRYGADFNIKDNNGNSPLMILVYKNNDTSNVIRKNYRGFDSFGYFFNILEVAELLIGHGADPNTVGCKGDTPLICAVRDDNIAMIDLLLLHGADPSIKNLKGEDAYFFAANNEIIKMLKTNKKRLVKLDKPEHCIIS